MRSVAFEEIFALKRHPVLNRDPTAESLDAFDIQIRDRFAVIEEPVKAIKWNLTVDSLIFI